MRYDLLDAKASVDWPVSQLPSFEAKINAWLSFNLEIAVKNPDPDIPYDLVVLIEKELLRARGICLRRKRQRIFLRSPSSRGEPAR